MTNLSSAMPHPKTYHSRPHLSQHSSSKFVYWYVGTNFRSRIILRWRRNTNSVFCKLYQCIFAVLNGHEYRTVNLVCEHVFASATVFCDNALLFGHQDGVLVACRRSGFSRFHTHRCRCAMHAEQGHGSRGPRQTRQSNTLTLSQQNRGRGNAQCLRFQEFPH